MKNDLMVHVEIPANFETNFNEDNLSISVSRQIECQLVNEFDKYLIDCMYEIYKNNGYTDIFLINKNEFEKFLKKYLPIYMNEKETQENDNNDTEI